MAERLSVRAGGVAGRHAMENRDMVMMEGQGMRGDLNAKIAALEADAAAARKATREAVKRAEKAEAEFKNFHRMLCERFGYSHDERHWKRDQVSLMEDIATALTTERQRAEAQNAKLKEALRAASRAADLALFVIRKQGVMPNASWHHGFEKDMAVARAALAETEGKSDDA
jgi:hypothetical protein